jgi:hypothetical protein
MDILDIAVRLGVATLVGVLLIDRRWPGRPSEPSDRPTDRTRAPGAEM